MKVAIIKERRAHERRVAASPDSVKHMVGIGIEPVVECAAGTIKAARVLVMGAGVAGLQAIATARRLGAIVSATDVRAAAKEQVESLGANFITVDEAAARSAETAGGYAREMDEDYQRRQREKVTR